MKGRFWGQLAGPGILEKRKFPSYQSLYYPTNAHNVKNVELLKHIKIIEAAPTCFDLQRNHHQGATAST